MGVRVSTLGAKERTQTSYTTYISSSRIWESESGQVVIRYARTCVQYGYRRPTVP